MWIVKLALSQPHTFIVMAICIALFGAVSIKQMAIDIFPTIDMPIVSCIWTYTGMPAANIENMITTPTERAFTSTVSGIEHMESMSLNGTSVIKIYLHKGSDIGQAVAQVTAIGNSILKTLPPGITPPVVTQSSATDVPVLQLVVGSKKLGEAELFDTANNFIRSIFAVVQGSRIPFPNGGKWRQVMVDLNPDAMVAYGLAPNDVVQAVNAQCIIAPSGTAKMGRTEYVITLNNQPQVIETLNNIPVKSEKGATVYVRDVAFVHDGFQPQLNVVNLDGHRAVIMSILKNGSASTLDVVSRIKALLPKVREIVPPSVTVDVLTDQSKFVSECVEEVFQEAVTAAGLTALLMLAILGSWRSTLIVVTSIPLAMLTSIIGLHLTGNTINSMTLGGLALAVGMLVDDATVEVENVHRQMEMGKHVEQAILDGAQEVALPAFVSTTAICIVFLPVFLLSEPARSLFVPLGLAVSFAMMASYGLSRTIVPLMSKHLFVAEEHVPGDGDSPPGQGISHASEGSSSAAGANLSSRQDSMHPASEQPHPGESRSSPAGAHANPSPSNANLPETSATGAKAPGFFGRIHKIIDRNFDTLRDRYHGGLEWCLHHRKATALTFLGFYGASFCLLPFIGTDFFPPIDAGQLRLHVNTPPGTRVEMTERIFRSVEEGILRVIPEEDIEVLTDNIGMPVSGVNYAFSDCQTVSEADGEILITLSEHRHHSTGYYQKKIREMMTREFPQCSYYFQPADIVTQILNAGLPAPIDIQVSGYDKGTNLKIALDIKREVERVPGAVDVCLHQVVNAPQYLLDVDRTRANQMGLTQRDISNSVLISLSSSFQVSPNFWVNPKNGVQYNLAAQTPQYRISSLGDLSVTAVGSGAAEAEEHETELLTNVATPLRSYTPAVVNHYNVQPMYNIYAACQDRDLGGVSRDVQAIVNAHKAKLARGSFIAVRGQVLSMRTAFAGLLVGLMGAVLLVYLLLVVNYQSWTDPLIILMAIPGALSGIIWSMFVTQTTFSIPALMGTIMTIGVASANSILMVTFCNEQRREGCTSLQAALNAGFQRFRPVCMTALAMIIGMIPMSLSAGQNAPIGRAVIGGLSVATFSTLIFVPLIYSVFRQARRRDDARPQRELQKV